MPDDANRPTAEPDASPYAGAGATPERPAYREVTVSAILVGLLIGAVMNAAITYAGLKIGFTIGGSAIAAVIGFGILRGILRRGTILETNITQTVASAVNTPNSGVIFTVPVLVLLGYTLMPNNLDFWLITVACVAGAILGGAFIVPLRKQMLDIERLRFPSATAVAAILKSPGAGPAKSVVLLLGIVIAALIATPAQLPQILRPADTGDLEELVEDERISRADMLLTQRIASWIQAGDAPDAVVEHGRLSFELIKRREANRPENKVDLSPDERVARTRAVRELQARVEAQQAVAVAELAQAEPIASDRSRLLAHGYPLELAKRAFLAEAPDAELERLGIADQRGEWDDLRATQAGWAGDPLFGYQDLQWRLPATEIDPEEAGDAPLAVDYAYNGITPDPDDAPDPVLSEKVDRDRDGRPDLLMTDGEVDLGRFLGLPGEIELIFAIAPFALGAGYLTGRAGLLVLAGGILAYFFINPIAYMMGWMPATTGAAEAPGFAFGSINRPLGIGLLLGGAMMGVIASLPAIKEAFKSVAVAKKGAASVASPTGGRDELGIRVLIVAALAAVVLLFVAADFTSSNPINTADPYTDAQVQTDEYVTEVGAYRISFAGPETMERFEGLDESSPEQAEERQAILAKLKADKQGLLSGLNPHIRAGLIAIVGALWIWFAGIIIAQCTGMTDWSPISGMALLTVVLVMLLGGPAQVVGAVLIGAALCVAITCAADMMADLKTGYLVGSIPRRQQTVELIFTGIGPIISMVVLVLITAANTQKFGIPIGPGTDTVAPQAQALQAVVTGVQGGEMPYMLYGLGAALGALLGLGAFSGLGVLVGLSVYLPFMFIATYGIGCVINIICAKIFGSKAAEEWGVPLAAGLIVGDAVLALAVNSAILAGV
jgi:uncharacterized oligopeptide transporter (OPT) family protein